MLPPDLLRYCEDHKMLDSIVVSPHDIPNHSEENLKQSSHSIKVSTLPHTNPIQHLVQEHPHQCSLESSEMAHPSSDCYLIKKQHDGSDRQFICNGYKDNVVNSDI